MSWGPVETVQEIEAGANMTPYTGYDITNPKNRFLNEIFKGTNRTAAPNKLLLYRLGATGQKQASAEGSPLTATAKYRGNNISIVITELTDPEDAFAVSTVVGGEIVDQQTAKTVEELSANDWVAWSGTGALAATVGKALSGGADGSPASADYTDFLAAIEPYKFDVLIYDGADTTVQDAMVAFAPGGGGGGLYPTGGRGAHQPGRPLCGQHHERRCAQRRHHPHPPAGDLVGGRGPGWGPV